MDCHSWICKLVALVIKLLSLVDNYMTYFFEGFVFLLYFCCRYLQMKVTTEAFQMPFFRIPTRNRIHEMPHRTRRRFVSSKNIISYQCSWKIRVKFCTNWTDKWTSCIDFIWRALRCCLQRHKLCLNFQACYNKVT